MGLEPPNETEIEKENGVKDVSTLGVIMWRKAENGVIARGMMHKMSRGTASHKTE